MGGGARHSARATVDCLEKPRPDALPAIGLAQADHGNEHTPAIAREMPGEHRQVADHRAFSSQREEDDAALVVVETAQLRLRPLRPGVGLTGNAEKLGLGVDLCRRRHQRRAVRRCGGADLYGFGCGRLGQGCARLFRELHAMLLSRDARGKS